MNIVRTTAAGFAATLMIGGLGAVAPAHADETAPEPCSHQQAQYDRASAKLAKLTEKWQANPSSETKKAKKAQVQRVAKAQARLEKCQAAQA
ncbi:hypothetical protein [Nocardioides sp. SR21]|uniref:hypothetical protein n=1 Tax=Nocardioides sp. SR21 TaxID=2919501 RepID=UPI001FAB0F9F|nr:hypothetical protein [Nocardioides sp. SR21]